MGLAHGVYHLAVLTRSLLFGNLAGIFVAVREAGFSPASGRVVLGLPGILALSQIVSAMGFVRCVLHSVGLRLLSQCFALAKIIATVSQ